MQRQGVGRLRRQEVRSRREHPGGNLAPLWPHWQQNAVLESQREAKTPPARISSGTRGWFRLSDKQSTPRQSHGRGRSGEWPGRLKTKQADLAPLTASFASARNTRGASSQSGLS